MGMIGENFMEVMGHGAKVVKCMAITRRVILSSHKQELSFVF